MHTFKHYSAELRHMPKYEDHPYLYVSDGEEEVYVFGVADLVAKTWLYAKDWGDTRSWLSPRNAPGSRAEVTANLSNGGMAFEQKLRPYSYDSASFEVPASDVVGFWIMLEDAAKEPPRKHPKILA